jgi:hypothetical protein
MVMSCSGISLVRSVTCVGPDADTDEYAVYATVLDLQDAPLTDSVDARLIGTGPPTPLPVDESAESARDWKAKQSQPACLRRVPMDDPHIPKGHQRFEGTLVFSRVGFNAARTEALVSLRLEASCGQEEFYRLRRDPDGWTVLRGPRDSVVMW